MRSLLRGRISVFGFVGFICQVNTGERWPITKGVFRDTKYKFIVVTWYLPECWRCCEGSVLSFLSTWIPVVTRLTWKWKCGVDLKQLRYNQSMMESLFRGKYANDDTLTNYDNKNDFQQTNKHGFARSFSRNPSHCTEVNGMYCEIHLGLFPRVWPQAKDDHWLSFHGAAGWTPFASQCHRTLVFLICACPCKCYQPNTGCEIGSWRSALMNRFSTLIGFAHLCRVSSGHTFVAVSFCSDQRNDSKNITWLVQPLTSLDGNSVLQQVTTDETPQAVRT